VRSREARFIGHGNFTQGEGHCRINAWRLTCSQCHDIKVIAMPHGDLPPNLLIKKFHQAGWNVGKKSIGDLCGACQKRKLVVVASPVPPPPPPAKPTTAPPLSEPEPDRGVITITVLRYKELTGAWRLQRAGAEPAETLLKLVHALLCAGKVDHARQTIEAHLTKATPPDTKERPVKAPRITPEETIKRDDTFDEWLNNLETNHRARRT
jgi:hypothetical protein